MSLFDNDALVKPGKKLPWEKLPREKPEHFEAFQTYLAMAERSLEEVAAKHNLNTAFVQGLAKTNQWLARSNAYDGQTIVVSEAEIIPSKVSTLKEMTDHHLSIARKAQYVAVTGLKVLENYMSEYEFARQAGEELPARPYLKPEDIVRIGKFGVDLERLSLGEATSRTETKATDYSTLSDDELKTLTALLAKTEQEDD